MARLKNLFSARGERRWRLIPDIPRGVDVSLCIAAVLLVSCLAPAGAQAETRTFLNDTVLFPVGGAGNVGPANAYPASIPVSGLSGTVTDVNVTLLGYESSVPDDNDVVLVGPNGAKVMVMSDACGTGQNNTINAANYVFDDAAPTFLSNNGPCPAFQRATFKPSNYLGEAPEPDDLSADGGPAPPYTNALSAFNGISPNGNWDLFVRDDNDAVFGFVIPAWALTLEIEPPPPATTPPSSTPPTNTPPTDTPPPNTSPPAPSNSFTIGDLDRKKLSVDVASAGKLTVADAGDGKPLLKSSSATGGPGTVEVALKPTAKAKRKIKRKGKVKLEAEITFAPTGGTPDSQTTKLKLRK